MGRHPGIVPQHVHTAPPTEHGQLSCNDSNANSLLLIFHSIEVGYASVPSVL